MKKLAYEGSSIASDRKDRHYPGNIVLWRVEWIMYSRRSSYSIIIIIIIIAVFSYSSKVKENQPGVD